MKTCKNTGRHKNEKCKLFYNTLYDNCLQARKSLKVLTEHFTTN